jgi:hypothetical protein
MSRFTAPNAWDCQFHTKSSFFNPFIKSLEFTKNKSIWPEINALAQALSTKKIQTKSGKLLQPYNQDDISLLESPIDYENLIYDKGLILTRPQNWHDFFNALIWLNFPATKGLLNEWHYEENKVKKEQVRSALQNKIAHFDECGMIILSDRPELFELIKEHQWSKFFCENKNMVKKHIRCIVFGHSILERLLNPYIGLTSKSLCFEASEDVMQSNIIDQVKYADNLCFDYLSKHKDHLISHKLQPFPMLGMTEIIEKGNFDYINNKNYFREKPVKR